jgi:hypothetical protein
MSSYLTTSAAASTYQTLSGMSSYLTTSAAASTYYPLSNPSGFITSSALTGYATESWVTSQGYLTDAPSDGSTYGRLNGAWAVVGGGGSVAWGGITGTLSDQTDLQTALDAKLDLAGGTMTGGLTLSATGIIFSDATTLTTAPAGSTLAADQLTAGVVTANPTTGPTASGDVLQYNGTDLVWAAGGGGGGLTISTLSNGATSTLNATAPTTGQALTYDGTDLVWSTPSASATWGSITGTLSSQTDLQTALDGKLSAKTVNDQSSNSTYTLAASDANNIIYTSAPLNLTIPKDATYSFPIGTHVMIAMDTSPSLNVFPEDNMTPAPIINGPGTVNATCIVHFIKVAADRWIVSL